MQLNMIEVDGWGNKREIQITSYLIDLALSRFRICIMKSDFNCFVAQSTLGSNRVHECRQIERVAFPWRHLRTIT